MLSFLGISKRQEHSTHLADRARAGSFANFLFKFRQSPVLSLILGVIMLVVLSFEWRTGVVVYRGKHVAGNWDFYFVAALKGVAGLFLTIHGVWSLLKKPIENDSEQS